MKLKSVALTGVLALSGLGLIGVGAHGAWDATTASSQTVNAGTPGVALWATNATNDCNSLSNAETYGAICNSITLTTPADVGSAFDAFSNINIVDYGDVGVTLTGFTLSVVSNNGTPGNWLAVGIGVCLQDSNANLYFQDSPFGTTTLASPIALATPNGTSAYNVDLYAGGGTSSLGCGSIPALSPNAEGGSVTVTITANYTA